MKLFVGVIMLVILSCAFLKYEHRIASQADIDRWRTNGVRIMHIDTLGNGLYRTYYK